MGACALDRALIVDRLLNGYTDIVIRLADEFSIRVRSHETHLPPIGTEIGVAPRPHSLRNKASLQ